MFVCLFFLSLICPSCASLCFYLLVPFFFSSVSSIPPPLFLIASLTSPSLLLGYVFLSFFLTVFLSFPSYTSRFFFLSLCFISLSCLFLFNLLLLLPLSYFIPLSLSYTPLFFFFLSQSLISFCLLFYLLFLPLPYFIPTPPFFFLSFAIIYFFLSFSLLCLLFLFLLWLLQW